jgi:O-antigen chain-terminating methyltransferase
LEQKTPEDLKQIIREIQERVRAAHPSGAVDGSGMALPDLMPIVHARDAAQAKVAAIGTVNPRRAGILNTIAQAAKKAVARMLAWHVREQVQFNQAMVGSLEAILETLDANNRALAEVAGWKSIKRDVDDLRVHWSEWRESWEAKLTDTEVRFLRSVAELQAAFQYRAGTMEADFRALAEKQHEEFQQLARKHQEESIDAARGELREIARRQLEDFRALTQGQVEDFRNLARTQHDDFGAQHEQAARDLEKVMWSELEKGHAEFQSQLAATSGRLDTALAATRAEFEKLIHAELRLVRQRASLDRPEAAHVPSLPGPSPRPAEPTLPFDYGRFAERFRGSEEYVGSKQAFYLPYFQNRRQVLDIGCGRGEFLELMKTAGVPARGIDLDAESVAICRAKGLEAEAADLFSYLEGLAGGSLDGIFSAQVVEHLPPTRVAEMIRLASDKLAPGGLLAIETPNPECLAIFATHFYLDPTHRHPLPHPLLDFYLTESGFGQVEVCKLSPAAESMPSLAALPEAFREAFFGCLDYAILGRKL